MKKYVSTKGYYSLKNIDGRIQDAETRLSDDIDECVTMLSGLMMDVVDPTVKVLWLGRRLALTIGGRDAGMIYGYLFLAGIVARIIMPDFKGMTAEKNKADGRLRYALSSVRTHSESIAFFGGGERERKIVWRRFLDVMKVENSKFFRICGSVGTWCSIDTHEFENILISKGQDSNTNTITQVQGTLCKPSTRTTSTTLSFQFCSKGVLQ